MEDKKFDSLIQDTLYQAIKNLNTSPDLPSRIHTQINGKKKEAFYMRRFGLKKLVVVVAALCILCSMGAVAAGKITSLTSSSRNTDNQYPAYSDVTKAEDELGYVVNAVEVFSNGYKYQKGNIQTVNGLDDDGNVVGNYRELLLDYQNAAGKNLNFIVCRPLNSEEGVSVPAKETRDMNGISVSYYSDHYKFFPADVTPSEEDMKAMEAGELYISYGSDKVIDSYASHIDWVQDETHYSLMSMDAKFEADEMYQMAKEVIEAK